MNLTNQEASMEFKEIREECLSEFDQSGSKYGI